MSGFLPRDRSARSTVPTIGVVAAIVLLLGLAAVLYYLNQRDAGKARTATLAATEASVTPLQATAPALATPVSAAPAEVAATDPQTLATREQALAAQLAALEARAATISTDVGNASGQAGRAEAMLVAFAARRAIDRGVGLGYVEPQLRARFLATQPRAVQVIVDTSRAAPSTVESLRQNLELIGADLVGGGATGLFSSIRQGVSDLVVFHRAGTPSPLPADRLARARRLLDGGQVDAALAEVNALPGADRATEWRAAARRYIDVHHALDTVESAAILGQTAATPPVPAPPR